MSERTTAIQFASVPNLDGGFDVTEAFAEFIIPLVADKPGFDSLTATLASRWADYAGSGSILAWKGGLDWQSQRSSAAAYDRVARRARGDTG